MYALEGGAVETLIVWESLPQHRIELTNPETQKKEVRFAIPEEGLEQANFFDPETNVQLEVTDDILLVEWLAEHYKDFGTRLEIVTDKSTEGSQFAKGFGGIGAMLRFQFDFPQEEIDDESFNSDDFI